MGFFFPDRSDRCVQSRAILTVVVFAALAALGHAEEPSNDLLTKADSLVPTMDNAPSNSDAIEGNFTPATPVEPSLASIPVSDDLSFKLKWKHGLFAESENGNFQFHVGGRTQIDAVTLDAEPALSQTLAGAGVSDAVDIRRGRLRIDGVMLKRFAFVAEYDFVNSINDNAGLPNQPPNETNVVGITGPTELWVGFLDIPIVGNVRVGNQKDPVGFEHLTSSRYLDFLERSYLQEAYFGPFNNGFIPGIAASRTLLHERMTLTTGVYRNTNNAFAYSVGDGEWEWSGRLTALPIYEDDGEKLIHLGCSFCTREPDNQQARFRTRGSLRNGPGAINPPLADTGLFDSTRLDFVALEFVAQRGIWSVQGEFVNSWNRDAVTLAGVDIGDYVAQGFYAQSAWFLTGEHREYERATAVFGRVIPRRNLFARDAETCQRGWGAWQFLTRFNYIDLTDGPIDGGTLRDVTVGLNWFLNPNMKFQFNYVITDRDAATAAGPNADGLIHGFGTRFAWDI